LPALYVFLLLGHNSSMKLLIIFSLLITCNVWGGFVKPERNGFFSGRISKINKQAELLRIKVDFANSKYLNKKDRVEFWDERSSKNRCKGYVVGKSSEYLLLKIPNYSLCLREIYLSGGVYLHFYSQDLVNNIKMGSELVSILLKKRVALLGRKKTKEIDLDTHIEKVSSINQKYKILREKLEAEWRDEIGNLEEDRLVSLQQFKELEIELANLNAKLEKYKIIDENMEYDRWSLDPRLYYKK
jgi:hypothetical protein